MHAHLWLDLAIAFGTIAAIALVEWRMRGRQLPLDPPEADEEEGSDNACL